MFDKAFRPFAGKEPHIEHAAVLKAGESHIDVKFILTPIYLYQAQGSVNGRDFILRTAGSRWALQVFNGVPDIDNESFFWYAFKREEDDKVTVDIVLKALQFYVDFFV